MSMAPWILQHEIKSHVEKKQERSGAKYVYFTPGRGM